MPKDNNKIEFNLKPEIENNENILFEKNTEYYNLIKQRSDISEDERQENILYFPVANLIRNHTNKNRIKEDKIVTTDQVFKRFSSGKVQKSSINGDEIKEIYFSKRK